MFTILDNKTLKGKDELLLKSLKSNFFLCDDVKMGTHTKPKSQT